ncbi:hypothetical protein [Neobacillus sp. FSL H8-0543]
MKYFLRKKEEDETSNNQPEKSQLENNGETLPEFDVHGTALNVLS